MEPTDPVAAAFRAAMRLNEAFVLRDDMGFDDIPGWDSLTHINLMVATEKRFKIKFATAEISRLKDEGQNVGTFLALIGKKLARTS